MNHTLIYCNFSLNRIKYQLQTNPKTRNIVDHNLNEMRKNYALISLDNQGQINHVISETKSVVKSIEESMNNLNTVAHQLGIQCYCLTLCVPISGYEYKRLFVDSWNQIFKYDSEYSWY